MFLPEYIGSREQPLRYEHGVPSIPVLTGKLVRLHLGSHLLLNLSTITARIIMTMMCAAKG